MMYYIETGRCVIQCNGGAREIQASDESLITGRELKSYEDIEESGLRERPIERILVPVDGSQHSDRALEFAIDLANRYSAEIFLLHVIPTMPICLSIPNLWEPFTPLYMVESESEGEEILTSALKEVREAGLRSAAWLDYGQPADRIVRAAREEGIDLIVMGSEKRGLIPRLFLGSVSDEVSRHAPCPVLIVKRTRKKNELKNRRV